LNPPETVAVTVAVETETATVWVDTTVYTEVEVTKLVKIWVEVGPATETVVVATLGQVVGVTEAVVVRRTVLGAQVEP